MGEAKGAVEAHREEESDPDDDDDYFGDGSVHFTHPPVFAPG
jgi:hypothetical protein